MKEKEQHDKGINEFLSTINHKKQQETSQGQDNCTTTTQDKFNYSYSLLHQIVQDYDQETVNKMSNVRYRS